VDFVRVLEGLARFFEERKLNYAVIGGVGIAGYGMSRATVDLDLVLDGGAQEEAIQFLESLGYETLHRSSGYSNHQHPLSEMGGVDLVYVRGETSRRIFEASRTLDGPGGMSIPVPSPEHLIAMKIVAMKNDSSRRFQDMADIRFLMGLPDIDREEVRAQFSKHGLLERFHELETG
jgi:Nucleotidyl transferase AbiEii toxin, Type IV TA system